MTTYKIASIIYKIAIRRKKKESLHRCSQRSLKIITWQNLMPIKTRSLFIFGKISAEIAAKFKQISYPLMAKEFL